MWNVSYALVGSITSHRRHPITDLLPPGDNEPRQLAREGSQWIIETTPHARMRPRARLDRRQSEPTPLSPQLSTLESAPASCPARASSELSCAAPRVPARAGEGTQSRKPESQKARNGLVDRCEHGCPPLGVGRTDVASIPCSLVVVNRDFHLFSGIWGWRGGLWWLSR